MTKKFEVDLSCFDADQRGTILQLVKHAAEEAVEDREIKEAAEFMDMDPKHQRLLAKDNRKVKNALRIWKNNGVVPGLAERVTYDELCEQDYKWSRSFHSEAQDAGFTSTDQPLLIKRVITEIVKEAIEPNIVLTPMMQTINYTHGTQLSFPAMGAITAADIPEGGEYPERSLEFAGQVVATIGKSGVAFKVTEEMIRYNLYDVISLHLTAAGRALIRWKEQKVADQITDNAGLANNILFDNASATIKSTTGRDANGAYNGTMTIDDIFYAYAEMINRGFQPDTLIMNPFAWEIFSDEAISRALGFVNGVGAWQAAQGSLASAPNFSLAGDPNGLGRQTQVDDPQNLATTFTNVPSAFPVPFNIVVTPYMPFNTTSKLTDLVFCNRSELGVLVVDETVTTDEWDDPARDIKKVKLRERYGLGSMNNGQGTGKIGSVQVGEKSYDFSRKLAPADVTLDSPLTGDNENVGVVV